MTRIGALLAVGAVAAVLGASQPAAGGRAPALHFRLVRASASATLRFQRHNISRTSVDTGRVSFQVKGKGKGRGTLSARGGRMRFAVRGRTSERVHLERNQTPPYQETTCAEHYRLSSKGGVTFKRTGSKVRVRWGFPQTRLRFCPGPRLSSKLTAPMKKLYPARHFRGRRVTITLRGTSTETRSLVHATYRWRATIRLERVG